MNASAGRPRNDFLGGIVDRAFERAAVIAPRPTSLFEPVAAAPASLHEADGEDVQGAFGIRAPATEHPPAESGDREIQASAHTLPVPSVPIAHEARRPPDGASARAAPAFAHESVLAQTLLRETRVNTIEREVAPALLVVREAAAAAAAPRRSHGDAGTDAIQASALPRVRDETPAHPDPLVAPARASLLPERAITAGFVPQAAPVRGDAAPSVPTAPVPSVTISIGRVEVRAAAAPKQPAAVKPVRQPMRLDEYLARKERTR
jgi:hypothetical protein